MEKGKIIVFGFTALLLLVLVSGFTGMVSGAATSSTSSEAAPTNIVVDFDSTFLDSNLRPGDSGILNLVVENTGGRMAENVQIWISGTILREQNKNFYIGRMDARESKTIPVIVRVDNNAKTGLNAIKVRIEYNGFDSDGRPDNNKVTNWEIPLIIYGDPLFQITPSKTTYFKDNLDELTLEGLTMGSVKDLEATVSSNCATIIGSSRKYVGNLDSGQKFNITYDIKPSSPGACILFLSLSYKDDSGSKVSDSISIGLKVEDAGVDFKVVNISYNPTGPGETTTVKINLKNVGQAEAEDTTLVFSLTDPFAPVDTSEKYLGTVAGGKTIDTEFNIAIGWDAEIKTYSIPLTINYKVGGTSYSVKKDVGVDVSGKVILEVINVESTGSSVRVEVANIGTRTAEGVKATLVTNNGTQMMTPGAGGTGGQRQTESVNMDHMNQLQEGWGTMNQTEQTRYMVSYKSDIKPNKQTTFTFSAIASGTATLILEYAGLNNQRVTQREKITLRNSAITGSDMSNLRGRGSGNNITTYILYAIIILVLVWVVYRKYKHKSILPDFLEKKLGRFEKSK